MMKIIIFNLRLIVRAFLIIFLVIAPFALTSISEAGVRMRPRLMASSQTSQKITIVSYSNGSLSVNASGGIVAASPWLEVGTDNPTVA